MAWLSPGLSVATYAIGDVGTDLAQAGIDACTLNNALNIAQLVVLVALVRWVRGSEPTERP